VSHKFHVQKIPGNPSVAWATPTARNYKRVISFQS